MFSALVMRSINISDKNKQIGGVVLSSHPAAALSTSLQFTRSDRTEIWIFKDSTTVYNVNVSKYIFPKTLQLFKM